MNLEIILNDMTKIYPSYDPQHKAQVIEFYKARFEEGSIAGWAII